MIIMMTGIDFSIDESSVNKHHSIQQSINRLLQVDNIEHIICIYI